MKKFSLIATAAAPFAIIAAGFLLMRPSASKFDPQQYTITKRLDCPQVIIAEHPKVSLSARTNEYGGSSHLQYIDDEGDGKVDSILQETGSLSNRVQSFQFNGNDPFGSKLIYSQHWEGYYTLIPRTNNSSRIGWFKQTDTIMKEALKHISKFPPDEVAPGSYQRWGPRDEIGP